MEDKMEWLKIFGILFIALFSIGLVSALPTGPSSTTIIGSTTYTSYSGANVSAIAGNVTELNFAANTVTSTWQGYFGNVTGTIVLGNANNQSLYNWNLTSPAGQVYATRTSSVPTWASIRCANQTEVDSEDVTLGVDASVDQDSVNVTFLNTTSFSQFNVGTVGINSSQDCRAVNLYNGSSAPSVNFAEVLLSDTSNIIYTGLIAKPGANGFDNKTHQFEMLVGENGHSGDTSATPYYFYLELH